MQQLEVKISSDGQTISFHSDSMKPGAYQAIDVQFPPNGKPKQRKKVEKAMQLQMRLEEERMREKVLQQ